MADQPWFETTLPPAEWFRLYKATGAVPETAPGSGQPWPRIRVNGHDAIDWLEQNVDGTANDDQLLIAEEFFGAAEYSAEADRFETPEEQRDTLQIRYGAAHWLKSLRGFGPNRWNILDYYLASFPGEYYCWACCRPFHSDHHAVALNLIDDILGHPLQPLRFDPSWRTTNVVAIATAMYESRDHSPAPLLADALEDTGCTNSYILDHCRTNRIHTRGCWVVDLVLGKE